MTGHRTWRQTLVIVGVIAAALAAGGPTRVLGGPIEIERPGRESREERIREQERLREERLRTHGAYETEATHTPTPEEIESTAKSHELESVRELVLPDSRPVRIVAELPSAKTSGAPRDHVVSPIATLVIMADSTQGFRNMFGGEPTAGQHADVQDFISKYTGVGAQVISDEATGQDALIKALETAAASHQETVIVGHALRNHGDTLLVLPDGTQVSVEELARRVPEANIVFLTCYSRDLDPESAISLTEAYAAWLYATAGVATKPTPSLPQQDIPPATIDDRDAATNIASTVDDRDRLLEALISRASSQIGEHPRVGIMWTSIDHGHGRWLAEAERDVEPNVSCLLMLAPAVLGQALLILVMIVIPKVGGNRPLRARLLLALQRRRRAMTISALGLIGGIAGSVCFALWRYLTRVGNPEPVAPLAVWAGIIGSAQAVLACLVARTTPIGSSPGRAIHSFAGGIVGVWRGLFGYVALMFEFGKPIGIAAVAIGVVAGWIAGDGNELLAFMVIGGGLLIALPVFVVIHCVQAATLAGRGEPVFG